LSDGRSAAGQAGRRLEETLKIAVLAIFQDAKRKRGFHFAEIFKRLGA